MKRLFAFILVLLFYTINLYADSGVAVGVGTNYMSLNYAAIGAFFRVEYFFTDYFSAGLRAGGARAALFIDGSKGVPVSAYELEFALRFYLPGTRSARVSFFAQAGAGMFVTQAGEEDGGTRGSPEYGGSVGLRFFLPKNTFLEFYGRGGYPYLGDGGIFAGVFIPVKGSETLIIKEPPKELPEPIQKYSSALE